jgi:CRP-like cAMP-binding protein
MLSLPAERLAGGGPRVATDVVDTLRRVWLFQGLDDKHLEQLARSFREREVTAGTNIVEQGQRSGIGFFVVVEGEAAVLIDGREVGKLGPGDHFGEVALVSDRVRTATVSARTDMKMLVMVLWDFRAFVQGDADVAWRMLQRIAGLLHESRAE